MKHSPERNEGVYNSEQLSDARIEELKVQYGIEHDGEYFQITGDDGRVHSIPSRVQVPNIDGPIDIEERIQQVLKEVRKQKNEVGDGGGEEDDDTKKAA